MTEENQELWALLEQIKVKNGTKKPVVKSKYDSRDLHILRDQARKYSGQPDRDVRSLKDQIKRLQEGRLVDEDLVQRIEDGIRRVKN